MNSAKEDDQADVGLLEASGLIKHVSHQKKKPGGKLRVLYPINLRGLEVEFYTQDVDIPPADQSKLEAGMTMQFQIKGDSRNGFTAHQLKPVGHPEYYGSVIKAPSTKNRTSRVIVSLDLTLDPVTVSVESIRDLQLKKPLASGDYVLVKIRWNNWIEALHANRKPEWEIVQVIDRVKSRPRSHSHGREPKQADPAPGVHEVCDEMSFEELSPQHRQQMRQRKPCHNGYRRRSRSVGVGSAPEDEFLPPPYYPYAQPQMMPYHYTQITPDMLYSPFANMYGPPPMWVTPNSAPPYMPRSIP